MSIEQMDKVIKVGEQMVNTNAELIKALSKMEEKDRIDFYPKVMSSIEHNQKTLNKLIHASGVNDLSTVAIG